MEKFQATIKGIIEDNLKKIDTNPMLNVFYPLIKLAKRALYEQLDKNPSEVYSYLKEAKLKIDEAIKVYEDEASAKP